MKAQDDARAQGARVAPGARRPRRAAQGAPLRRHARRADPPGHALLLHAAAGRARRRPSSSGRKAKTATRRSCSTRTRGRRTEAPASARGASPGTGRASRTARRSTTRTRRRCTSWTSRRAGSPTWTSSRARSTRTPRGRPTAPRSTTRSCPWIRRSRRPSARAGRTSACTGSGRTRRPTRSCSEKLGDPTTFQNVDVTRDGRFLFLVVSHGWTSTDVSFRDLEKDPAATDWTPLAVGVKAHFNVDTLGRTLFVKTDDGAPKGRIFERRSREAGAGGLEGGRPRTARRGAPGLRRRRREARARLPEERLEPPRDPQPRRHARARGAAPRHRVGERPLRPGRRRRGVLLVRVVHDADVDLPDVGEDRRDGALRSRSRSPRTSRRTR